MNVYQNALEMIGQTPMLALNQLDTGPCQLFVKLELCNPAGSIKDRIGLKMIEAAEAAGDIKPGDTLVEATAGNTGLGLALVAAQKGYKLLIIMPDKMSQEKVAALRAMGAEVRLTRSDVYKGHPEYFLDLAKSTAEQTPNAYLINQFANEANALAHEEGTAPEIWQQLDGQVDAFVCGVGSGGTLTGVGRYIKKHQLKTEMVLADPQGSVLADLVNKGEAPEPGKWLVEGVGEDYVPDICDLSFVDKAYTIPCKEAFATVHEVLAKTGILAGTSSGTLVAAALRYCREQTEPKRVVTLLCDTGNRYLSKAFNPQWLAEQGLS